MQLTRRISRNYPKLFAPLQEVDPEIADIIEYQRNRFQNKIVLTLSENYQMKSVLQASGTVMSTRIPPGWPGARLNDSNKYIENLCRERAFEIFKLNQEEWGLEIHTLYKQPTIQYLAALLLNQGEAFMSLNLPSGGFYEKIQSGFVTALKQINLSNQNYKTEGADFAIDYDEVWTIVKEQRPQILLIESSPYSRHIDFQRLREIAVSVDAILVVDMARYSGLVAADIGVPSPFSYADIVVVPTHRALNGPLGSMIFYNRASESLKKIPKLDRKISAFVSQEITGPPVNTSYTQLATALKLVQTDDFKDFQTKTLSNAQALARRFRKLGINMTTGGTDNSLVIVDLKQHKIDGARLERMLASMALVVLKHTLPNQKRHRLPLGIRVSTDSMTLRGFGEEEFEQVAEFINAGIEVTQTILADEGYSPDLQASIDCNSCGKFGNLQTLRQEVDQLASQFPIVWN